MAIGEGRTKKRRGWVVAGRVTLVVLIGLTAACAVVVSHALKPRATPPAPVPVPNAYDDIVRAGRSIRGEVPNQGRIRGAKLDELRAWVGQNPEPLKNTRAALALPSRVPVVYSNGPAAFGKTLGDCRMVGRLLLADAEIAALEKRPDAAARVYLQVLRLSDAIARGGLMIDALGGIAVESQAVDGLSRVCDDLPPDELRRVIPILLRHDQDRDPWPVVLNAEDYWVEQTQPALSRLMLRVSGVGQKLRAPADKSARQALRRAELGIRSLAIRMAGRLYRLDRGSEPDGLAGLVPDYLPEVPKHPETGLPIEATP